MAVSHVVGCCTMPFVCDQNGRRHWLGSLLSCEQTHRIAFVAQNFCQTPAQWRAINRKTFHLLCDSIFIRWTFSRLTHTRPPLSLSLTLPNFAIIVSVSFQKWHWKLRTAGKSAQRYAIFIEMITSGARTVGCCFARISFACKRSI